MKFYLLFRWASLWVGAHYSPYNRRWYVNFVPCVTFCVVLKGGISPIFESPKYVIVTFADQTIAYITEEKCLTTSHKEAFLFNDKQNAQNCMESLIKEDKSNKVFTERLKAISASHEDWYSIETITDEKEFRARPNTW